MKYINIEYYTIIHQKLIYWILGILLLNIQTVSGQQIPEKFIKPVCNNQHINTGAPGNSQINTIRVPCGTFSQNLSTFLDFYYIKILQGTTFTFAVQPAGNDDYDFMAYLNPNWNNINNTPDIDKRGSQNNPISTGQYGIGLSLTATDVCEPGGSTGYPEPGFVKYFSVKPGDEILIVIDRWSRTNKGYTMSFDGGGDAVLDCTIVGNTYRKCALENGGDVTYTTEDFTPDLNKEYPDANFKFYYEQIEAEKNSSKLISFPLSVRNQGGKPTEIYVRIETKSGGFISVIRLFLDIRPLPVLKTDYYELPYVCDNDGDGKAIFDLTQSEKIFVSGPEKYKFLYYYQEEDVYDSTATAISDPNKLLSKDTTIYVRIETIPSGNEDITCFVTGKIRLAIRQSSVSEDTVQSCSSYTWNGNVYRESGRYTSLFTNINGCDSVDILNLTIFKQDTVETTTSSCDSYIWKNVLYTESGKYQKVYQNINGCDSVEVLNLILHPHYLSTSFITVCDSFTWSANNQTYTENGTYTQNLQTSFGCDSISRLILKINKSATHTEKVSTCSPYTWNGKVYDSSGTYEEVFKTMKGCDSIRILQLSVHKDYKDTSDVVVCDSYTWPVNNQTFYNSGIYNYPYRTASGCDSLLTLSLQINPSFIHNDTIRAIDEYTWPINQETYTKSGIYTASYLNKYDCDSLYTLNLTVEDNTQFFFPNIITKDGVNSYFTGYSNKGALTIRHLSVFDRWGNLIFKNENFPSNQPEDGWNGSYNGRYATPGVYIWVAEVENKNGTLKQYKGDITIIK